MRFPDVLVLGATGRIGRVLRQCWPLDHARWQTRRAMKGPGWVPCDPLADPTALTRAAEGCHTILCLAGVTPVQAAAGAPLQDNPALARAAIRAGAETGARVLLTSSAAVYGRAGGVLHESQPLAPVSDYGRSKADMETAAADLAAQLGVTACALRIGNIAGLDAILGGWHPGFRLDRFADGRTPMRSYIGPVALARILGDLCALPDLPDALNIAAPTPIEMAALLDAAGLGWSPRPARADAIAHVHLAVDRLTRLCPPAPADPAGMVAEWQRLNVAEGHSA